MNLRDLNPLRRLADNYLGFDFPGMRPRGATVNATRITLEELDRDDIASSRAAPPATSPRPEAPPKP